MTKKEIYKLILKVLGIYSIILGCTTLPVGVLSIIAKKPLDNHYILDSSDAIRVVLLALVPIAYFIISYFLLRKTEYITNETMKTDMKITFFKDGKNASSVFELIIVTTGWTVLLNYVNKFSQSLTYFTYNKDYGVSTEGIKFLSYGTSKIVAAIFMVILGLCFIYYATKIVNYIYPKNNQSK